MKSQSNTLDPERKEAEYVFKRNFNNGVMKASYSQIIASIRRIVALHFEVPMAVIEQRGRKSEHIIVRQLVQYFIYVHCPHMSLSSIGSETGGSDPFDHCTVRSNLKRISDIMETDKRFTETINQLNDKIVRDIEFISSEISDPSKFYLLDMDRISIMDIKEGKAIVFVGMTEDEIKKMMMYPATQRMNLRNINNTGFKIVKKIEHREPTVKPAKPTEMMEMQFHFGGIMSKEMLEVSSKTPTKVVLRSGEDEWQFSRRTGKCLNDNTFGGAHRTIKPF